MQTFGTLDARVTGRPELALGAYVTISPTWTWLGRLWLMVIACVAAPPVRVMKFAATVGSALNLAQRFRSASTVSFEIEICSRVASPRAWYVANSASVMVSK